MTAPRFHLVFFDVDSTLVTIEGIDVLGASHPEIAELTERAMNGEIPLEDVYGRRLEIIKPGRRDLEVLGETYKQSLVDGAEEVVRSLLDAGCDVQRVTAGILQAVLPLARHLGLRESAVHAVSVDTGEDGAYRSFDTRSKLIRTRGKETVILNARARSHGRAVLIGDGVSDLEAREAVDLFIGFGGVRARDIVRREAAVFIDEPSLRPLLPIILGGAL